MASGAPPPYSEHPQEQHLPYGFTTNAGQPHPQAPYMQRPIAPPGYNYQPDYVPPQPGYVPPQPGYVPPQPGYVPPQPGYVPPQPGYVQPQPDYKSPQPGYTPPQPGHPAYGTIHSQQPPTQTVPSVSHPGRNQTVTVQPQGNNTVAVLGGCPTCRTGVLEDSYTCLGVCCAIVCFPIGILCCMAMKEKRCQNCHATF